MEKSLLTLLFTLVIGFTVEAQEITGFKTETFTNEYGNYRLKIIPNTFDGTKPKITKTSGVYGVRICYTQNGVKKAAVQDMTYKIVNNGVYEYGGWGSGKGVDITDITFFRADKMPREDWPTKEDCK